MTLKAFLKWLYPLIFLIRHWRFIFALGASIATGFVVFIYYYIFAGLPSPRSLTTTPIPLTTHIRDRNGKELYKVYDTQNRTLVRLSNLSPYIVKSTISIEDKEFYKHRGFSIVGISRALISDIYCALRSDHCVLKLQGGSTITQQLVKTSLLSPEQTIRRKIKELILSLAVESLYSKDQILEMYLNRVSYGGAAYGIEEASQTYFGLPASKLSLAQASLLAGLPASPTTFSPYGSHPESAKHRQNEVLRRLVEDKVITWDQAEAASREELRFRPPQASILAPHFVMYVKEVLSQKFGADIVEQGGLDVITTLDLTTQDIAQTAVTQEIAKLKYLHVTNGAALVTRPGTGEILAMVGSTNYFDLQNDGNVNVTLSHRQPGSSIKPLNYALAFSRGYTPASYIDDSPVTYHIAGSADYSPVNYDGRYHGRVTLRQALANSYNIPSVKLLAANGVSNLVGLAQKMGITTWPDNSSFGLSLSLGAGEVSMVDLATAYGVFANSGNRINLNPILSIRDASGKPLPYPTPPVQSVLDPRIAFFVSDILSDNTARTPTFGSRSDLYIPSTQVAVKTGTTNNLRDNWTIGYTTDLLAAVWVGNNDNTPMSYIASGVTGASPIWKKIMSQLLKDQPAHNFATPSGLIHTTNCSNHLEYFLEGSQPICPTPLPEKNVTPPPQLLPAITYAPYQPPVYPTPTPHRPLKRRR